jgi:tol-pal system-associated acyl-CoA thioesterase
MSDAPDGEIGDGRHVMPVRVYYEDTDFTGIVYHANYLRFMERGRTNHLRLMGAEQHALFAEAQAETPGFAFVVRSMQIDSETRAWTRWWTSSPNMRDQRRSILLRQRSAAATTFATAVRVALVSGGRAYDPEAPCGSRCRPNSRHGG